MAKCGYGVMVVLLGLLVVGGRRVKVELVVVMKRRLRLYGDDVCVGGSGDTRLGVMWQLW